MGFGQDRLLLRVLILSLIFYATQMSQRAPSRRHAPRRGGVSSAKPQAHLSHLESNKEDSKGAKKRDLAVNTWLLLLFDKTKAKAIAAPTPPSLLPPSLTSFHALFIHPFPAAPHDDLLSHYLSATMIFAVLVTCSSRKSHSCLSPPSPATIESLPPRLDHFSLSPLSPCPRESIMHMTKRKGIIRQQSIQKQPSTSHHPLPPFPIAPPCQPPPSSSSLPANEHTYRLSQLPPLLHLMKAMVQRRGEVVMPQGQVSELRLHGPIPKEGEERKEWVCVGGVRRRPNGSNKFFLCLSCVPFQ